MVLLAVVELSVISNTFAASFLFLLELELELEFAVDDARF